MRSRLAERVDGLGEVEWLRSADVRYRGQNWSITVDVPGETGEIDTDVVIERFEAEHERLYGTRLEAGSPVVIRALRLTVVGPPRGGLASVPRRPPRRNADRRGRGSWTSATPTGASRRASSRAGRDRLGAAAGPLLVDEYDTTVVVPPEWTVALGPSGALVLEHVPVDDRRSAAAGGDRAGRDPAADRRERARHRRGRDGDDDLPHCPLRRRPRRDGLLGRPLRADGRDDRAGGHDPAPARLDPARDEDAVRALRRQPSRPATSTWSTTRSTERATRPTSSSSSPPSRTAG